MKLLQMIFNFSKRNITVNRLFLSIVWSHFVRRSLLLAAATLIMLLLKHGFTYDSGVTLLEVALLFGLVSGACYTLIATTKIKLLVQRIGFFNFFLNAGLLYLVALIIPTFRIDRFATAFWGGFLFNLISWLLGALPLFFDKRTHQRASVPKQVRARVIGTRRNEDQ
jgi:uncharacterized membrane protein YvlD (DUF360 family)